MIAFYGTGWTLLVNVLTFVFVLVALSRLRVSELSHRP